MNIVNITKARKVHKELMDECRKSLLLFIIDYTKAREKAVTTPKKRTHFISKGELAKEYMLNFPEVTFYTTYKLYRQGYPLKWCLKGKNRLNRLYRKLVN